MITAGARDQQRGIVAGSGAECRGGQFDETVASGIFCVPRIPATGMRLEKLFERGEIYSMHRDRQLQAHGVRQEQWHRIGERRVVYERS